MGCVMGEGLGTFPWAPVVPSPPAALGRGWMPEAALPAEAAWRCPALPGHWNKHWEYWKALKAT